MNISDLDCPQFVNFMDAEFILSYKNQDELMPSPLQTSKSDKSPKYSEEAYIGNPKSNVESSLISEASTEYYPCQDSTSIRSDYSSLKYPRESDDENANSNMEYNLTSDTSYTLAPSSLSQNDTLTSTTSQEFDSLASSIEEFPVVNCLPFKEYKIENAKAASTNQVKNNHSTKIVSKGKNEYIPLAEQVAIFQTKTPERFHTAGPKDYQPRSQWVPHKTIPESPHLQAVKRRRVLTALSQEELELKEAEEIKKYRFHAKPLDPKVLLKPTSVKKNKKHTKPINIQLKTAQRAAEQYAKQVTEEKYEFHANPVPKTVFLKPNEAKKVSMPATVPQSPAFILKTRAEKWKNRTTPLEIEKNPEFKAQPLPVSNAPFEVKHEKTCTLAQPFSFELRDKERYLKKKRKIEEIIDKENTIPPFKAQALPECIISRKTSVDTTTISAKDKLQRMNETLPIRFKAQPPKVLYASPFVPKKLQKETTHTKEFQLETEKRAKKWQDIQEQNYKKELEKEKLLQEEKARQEELERQEILKLRKETVHKANPVPNYKTIDIKPSSKPLTRPTSPNFATNKRIKE